MQDGRKSILLIALTLGLTPYLPIGVDAANSTKQAAQEPRRRTMDGARNTKSITYKNKKYRFRFVLPVSWKGYSIIASQWGGSVLEEGLETFTRDESGPLITIRHPRWANDDPWQDIPIMIFTHAQWKFVDENRLVVSAAPFGPNEIGRNAKYVFALPPRYNYADANGQEEVVEILQHHPLRPY